MIEMDSDVWADQRISGAIMLLIFVLIFSIYMLPTIIAFVRRKEIIAALNFFGGWTMVGWIMSLIWALIKEESPKHIIK